MKRFWLVLLSLGLVMAFSASAFAVDVKFSGQMYVAGMHFNRTNLDDVGDGTTTSFYAQRLRMFTDFVVAPGVTLKTRYDIMERVWGATRTAPGTTLGTLSMGTQAENENIAFDRAYIQYDSPYGSFQVGARSAGTWGTTFGDSEGHGCYRHNRNQRIEGECRCPELAFVFVKSTDRKDQHSHECQEKRFSRWQVCPADTPDIALYEIHCPRKDFPRSVHVVFSHRV